MKNQKSKTNKSKRQRRLSPVTLLADVMRYRRGLGRYDFGKMPTDARPIYAMEAWEELESRIDEALSKAGMKVG